MLDIKFIRENSDEVQKAAHDKGVTVDISHILTLDARYRELLASVQKMREERNKFAKEKKIEQGRQLKVILDKEEHALSSLKAELDAALLTIPNIPAKDVPLGKDESGNVEIRRWGEPKKFQFTPRDHVELGKLLDIIDIEHAGKVAGTRFSYLKREAALLEFALVQYAFEILTNQDVLGKIAKKIDPELSITPFIPVIPPVMIRPEVFRKMARIDPEEERYSLTKDELFLIGSAEHTLGPLHMDEVIFEKDLPIRYVGFSTAFRREAGSYGKDTRGILRVHQFDKIEMESFTTSENSVKEQDFFVALQEHLMQALEIPYRVMMICTGDMGAPDSRQIDIESWIPSQNKYRETHTADLMTDYQSRRLNTKVVRKDNKAEFVHMNDATVFAIGRTLIAILENYQQEDGSVVVPEVLRKYTHFDKISPKASQ